MDDKRFSNYDEFFVFYLEQHSNPNNRLLHACGTVLAVSVLVFAVATRHYVWSLVWIPVAYGFAWVGHLLVEGNKPATFGHPWWSFISDFRMLGLMVRGKLSATSSEQKAVGTRK